MNPTAVPKIIPETINATKNPIVIYKAINEKRHPPTPIAAQLI